MLMPPIDRYVTRQPWVISAQDKLAVAHDLMRAHEVRHLPVLDHGKLVGVLSERDLYLLRSIAGISLHETPVREAMSESVYAVASGTSLDEVVNVMSDRKYGSSIVLGGDGTVLGIFTTVDACRALAEILQRAVA